jgi:SH3 domain protein
MRLMIGLMALLPIIAIAETAYVTDNLRLRMYADPDLTSVVETLQSGDSFEVLSRNAQTALVELADGRQGYVSAAYIVYDKPAKLIVAESQAEVERVTAALDSLKASFAEPQALVDRLQAESAELEAKLDAATARAVELEESNQSLVEKQARYRYSLPYTWVAGAIVICLVAGVLLGQWWDDRKSRKRHGGIRVY